MIQTLSREEQTVDMVEVLGSGLDRLKEEHLTLKHDLMELYGMARAVGLDDDVINWSGSMDNLRRKLTVFMNELDVHSEWEDHVLFPMVQEYSGEDMVYVSSLEADHERAKEQVHRFIEASSRLSAPVCCQQAREAAALLLDAYETLNSHFQKEEEVLFPIAEQMLTDMEQFFS